MHDIIALVRKNFHVKYKQRQRLFHWNIEARECDLQNTKITEYFRCLVRIELLLNKGGSF